MPLCVISNIMYRFSFLLIVVVILFSQITYSQSAIAVEIKTNVNTIDCEVAAASIHTSRGNLSKGYTISIPVEQLGCPDGVTKDLIKHLNAKEYPNIKFTVCDIEYDIDNKTHPKTLKVDVQVADKVVTYSFNVVVASISDEEYITGTLGLQLAHFNIEPPTKMLGLVKVKDRINISFSLPIAS